MSPQPGKQEGKKAGDKVPCVLVPADALDRLLSAAESVGGQYEGVHPVLRECHVAAVDLREALR